MPGAAVESLAETARQELSELLGISGDPIFTRLTRWARQSPQFAVGHQLRVASIEQRLKALPGLFLAGSVLFHGALYALAFGGPRWLGVVAPIGGAAFILGWLSLGLAALLKAETD